MKDFIVSNQGSLTVLTPMNEEAAEWITSNIQFEQWQLLGGANLAIDARYSEAIITGIVNAGMEIEIF